VLLHSSARPRMAPSKKNSTGGRLRRVRQTPALGTPRSWGRQERRHRRLQHRQLQRRWRPGDRGPTRTERPASRGTPAPRRRLNWTQLSWTWRRTVRETCSWPTPTTAS